MKEKFPINLTVSNEVYEKALLNLENQTSFILVFSGKMGSGKDTLGEKVSQNLGLENAVRCYYADALKNELDEVLETVKDAGVENVNYEMLLKYVNNREDFAKGLLERVKVILTKYPNTHARERHDEVRECLQYFGTVVWRSMDSEHWTSITLSQILEIVSTGKSVYVTDARFPNEVALPKLLGAKTVRLNVDKDTQIRRILERDGKLPLDEAMVHVSETSLDTWEDFDIIVDNNVDDEDKAAQKISNILQPETREVFKTQTFKKDFDSGSKFYDL